MIEEINKHIDSLLEREEFSDITFYDVAHIKRPYRGSGVYSVTTDTENTGVYSLMVDTVEYVKFLHFTDISEIEPFLKEITR